MRRGGLEGICRWLAASKDDNSRELSGTDDEPPLGSFGTDCPKKKRKLSTPYRCEAVLCEEVDSDGPLDLSTSNKPNIDHSVGNGAPAVPELITSNQDTNASSTIHKLDNNLDRIQFEDNFNINGAPTCTVTSPSSIQSLKSRTSLLFKSKGSQNDDGGASVLAVAGRDAEVYIQRVSGFEQCGVLSCRAANLREHFHCTECMRVMVRREEMIRHVKWHKKREESLVLGFMRYSPSDDCPQPDCQYFRKQTHYHCIQNGCGKVYISTSDVQIHANFHRKDQAIVKQGFQRFRATELCPDTSCPFYSDRTTHFHCLRPNCSYSFKNKADMEKHKNHHWKNEEFAKDGFRKYMKHEACDFPNCKFSKIMNHIHCIRQNCDFVVHSSSQILSHCRKHERRKDDISVNLFNDDNVKDGELSVASSTINSMMNAATAASTHFLNNNEQTTSVNSNMEPYSVDNGVSQWAALQASFMSDTIANMAARFLANSDASSQQSSETIRDDEDLSSNDDVMCLKLADKNKLELLESTRLMVVRTLDGADKEELFQRYIRRYTANDPCVSHCSLLFKDHYHCQIVTCNALFKSKEKVRNHIRLHYLDEEYTKKLFDCSDGFCSECEVSTTIHYHCKYCSTVFQSDCGVFAKYHHIRLHEVQVQSKHRMSNKHRWSNPDSFMRKRGRPPKMSLSALPVPDMSVHAEAVVDDTSLLNLSKDMFTASSSGFFCGFKMVRSDEECYDDKCLLEGREHYHCARARCHSVSQSISEVNLHRNTFHSYVYIDEGFEYFDQHVDCRRPNCPRVKVSSHYHCTRPHCNYHFVRYNTMEAHKQKHEENSKSRPDILPAPPALLPVPTTPTMIYNADLSCGRSGCPFDGDLHVHCSFSSCDQPFSDAYELKTHICRQSLPLLQPKPSSQDLFPSQNEMFSVYGSNQDCSVGDCEHRYRYQHFHCSLCAYVCKDIHMLDQHTLRHANAFLATQVGFNMTNGNA